MTQSNQEPIYLQQKEIHTSHKTLGTYKTIIGLEDDHVCYLEEKSNTFAKKTENSQFNSRQAVLAYNCNSIPSIMYSLTAVSLNKKQIQNIQKKPRQRFKEMWL
jgi:hypothetical protein